MTFDTNMLIHERYRIIRQIGKGGMGAVYEAFDERLSQPVALKQMTIEGEQFSKAFEREAKILAALRHPGLTRVIDHFIEESGQFLVMDFVPGDDLEILLAQRCEPFPLHYVLEWADQLLSVLDYLHTREKPVIHRDIKPQNLKLSPEGQVVLIDFGLAKGTPAAKSLVDSHGSILGYTPQYAPLEQIQGTGTGPRSDLYALAATLHHLLTGDPPPDVLTRVSTITNQSHDPLRPVQELCPDVPEDVGVILQQALSMQIDGRPVNAAAMRRQLLLARQKLDTVVGHQEPDAEAYTGRTISPASVEENVVPPVAWPQKQANYTTAPAPPAYPSEQLPPTPTAHPSAETQPSIPPVEPAPTLLSSFTKNVPSWVVPALGGGGVVLIVLVAVLLFSGSSEGDATNGSSETPLAAVLETATAVPTIEPSPTIAPSPTVEPTPALVMTMTLSDDELETARADLLTRTSAYQEILRETFDRGNTTKALWGQPNNEQFRRQLIHDYYRLTLKQPESLTWDHWSERRLGSTYMVQLDIAFEAGGGGGIVFDVQDDAETMNGFIIRSNNKWEFVTIEGGKIVPERSASFSIEDTINGGGGTNQMFVLRLPEEVQLWINNTPLGTVAPVFDGGYVGVVGFAGPNESDARVLVDNFFVSVP
jgi:serine/threonine protein kinase